MNKIDSIQVSRDSLSTLLAIYCNSCGYKDCTMNLFDENEFECPFKGRDCSLITKSDWKIVIRHYLEGEIRLTFSCS